MNIELGYISATAGIVRWLADHDGEPIEKVNAVQAAIERHASGDWGEVCDGDKDLNDLSAAGGDRVLSAYTIDGEKIWIITEGDRSATTVLLPSEY